MEVDNPFSDIDTVCLCPSFISRDTDFFISFYQILKENEKITEIHKIIDANVPLIKINYEGVQVDITLCLLNSEFFSNLQNINLMNNCILNYIDDEKSLKALNGIRNCNSIINNLKNLEEFKICLKFIKKWAKNKGIYSSLMGYLGGFSWTILVAKICQMYPDYSAFQLIER